MPSFTDYSLDLAHYVRIEGIGVPSGAGFVGLYVFDQLPDWTPSASQMFVPGLRLNGGVSQSAEPYGGIADVSKLAFEVQDFISSAPGVWFWASLMATERWNADPATFSHTFLDASMDRDDVAMTVESTAGFPAAPSYLWVGAPGNQECVRYGAMAATSFSVLTRGQFPATGNAFARTHRVGQDVDGNALAPVLVTTRPQSFFGLRVAVYSIARRRDGTWEPEGSAVRRWTGFIRHAEYAPNINGFRFRCDPLTQALDRDVYNPTRIYRSRIVGHYIGPRTDDRTLRIHAGAAAMIPVVVADEWYESAFDLAAEINRAIAVDWQANARDYRRIPVLHREDGMYHWEIGRIIGGVFYTVSVEMPVGISNALGRFPFNAAHYGNSESTSVDEYFRVEAQFPAPDSSLYWPVGYDGDITMRVASRDGVITNQGDFSAGPLLVGGRYSARVTGSAAGVLADTLTVRSEFDGRPFSGIDRAQGISIIADEDGASMVGEDGPDRWMGSAFVEQVFVPSGGVGFGVTLRRLLLSTGTTNYNTTDDVLADGYGVGIDDDDVDRFSFSGAVFNAGVRDNEAFRYLWRAPVSMREVLEDSFKVLGIAVIMVAGRLTARSNAPFGLARNAVATIDDAALFKAEDRPNYTVSPEMYVNGVKLTWGWNALTEEYRYPDVVIRTAQSLGAAENRLVEVESKGMTGSPERVAETEAGNLLAWLGVFNRPQARVRLRLSARWINRLVPTDVVLVSLTSLHNRHRGGYGTSALIGIVLSVSEPWYEGPVEVDLLLLNEQRQAPLAPSALLDYARGDGGWDAVNNRLYLRDNEFTDAPDLDVNWFLANDRILVCQDNANDPTAPRLWRVTVQSVTGGAGGYLTLTGALPAPAFVAADNYFVTFDTYDVVPSGRYDDGTWIADDADSRIGATNDWYPYT